MAGTAAGVWNYSENHYVMSIKAIVTGATGMVGKGVLFECLKDPRVESVLVINRSSLGMNHPKLKEIIHSDFFDLSPIRKEFTGYNACFFCLGVTSFRMSEEAYHKITHDLTLHMAHTILELNPDLTFIYVSGTGTDSSEKGRVMWARVKGKTENALLGLSFKNAYMFRPGFIQPKDGIRSRTKLYNALYTIFTPLYPILNRLFPRYITSTDRVGKAMIEVTQKEFSKKHLENRDINELIKL